MWNVIFTRNEGDITIQVSKSFYQGKSNYSIKIGTEKPDRNSGTDAKYLAPFIGVNENTTGNIISVLDAANDAIMKDKMSDIQVESDRIKSLAKSANPGLSHKHKGLKNLSKEDKVKRDNT